MGVRREKVSHSLINDYLGFNQGKRMTTFHPVIHQWVLHRESKEQSKEKGARASKSPQPGREPPIPETVFPASELITALPKTSLVKENYNV